MSHGYYTVIDTVSVNSHVLYTYVFPSLVLFPFLIPLYNFHNRVVTISNTNFGTVLCTYTIVVVVVVIVNGYKAIFAFTAVFIFIKPPRCMRVLSLGRCCLIGFRFADEEFLFALKIIYSIWQT